jgi:hypothetical protein
MLVSVRSRRRPERRLAELGVVVVAAREVIRDALVDAARVRREAVLGEVQLAHVVADGVVREVVAELVLEDVRVVGEVVLRPLPDRDQVRRFEVRAFLAGLGEKRVVERAATLQRVRHGRELP